MPRQAPNYRKSNDVARSCTSCAYCSSIFGQFDPRRVNLCYRFSPVYAAAKGFVCDAWEARADQEPEEK